MINSEINIVTITGASGVGKTTLLERLPATYHRVITSTSRLKRDGERDGIDYHFRDVDYFKDNSKFIEKVNHLGVYYGTSIDAFNRDKTNIIILNREGVDYFKDLGFNLVSIYLKANKDTLIQRINATETNTQIKEKRLSRLGDELKLLEDFEESKVIDTDNLKIEEVSLKVLKLIEETRM